MFLSHKFHVFCIWNRSLCTPVCRWWPSEEAVRAVQEAAYHLSTHKLPSKRFALETETLWNTSWRREVKCITWNWGINRQGFLTSTGEVGENMHLANTYPYCKAEETEIIKILNIWKHKMLQQGSAVVKRWFLDQRVSNIQNWKANWGNWKSDARYCESIALFLWERR